MSAEAIAVAKSMVGKIRRPERSATNIIERSRVRDTIDSSNLITVRYNVFISTTLMSKEREEN